MQIFAKLYFLKINLFNFTIVMFDYTKPQNKVNSLELCTSGRYKLDFYKFGLLVRFYPNVVSLVCTLDNLIKS